MAFTQEEKINSTEYCAGCDKKCTVGFVVNNNNGTSCTLPAIAGCGIATFLGKGNKVIDTARVINAYKEIYGVPEEDTALVLARHAKTLCDHYKNTKVR